MSLNPISWLTDQATNYALGQVQELLEPALKAGVENIIGDDPAAFLGKLGFSDDTINTLLEGDIESALGLVDGQLDSLLGAIDQGLEIVDTIADIVSIIGLVTGGLGTIITQLLKKGAKYVAKMLAKQLVNYLKRNKEEFLKWIRSIHLKKKNKAGTPPGNTVNKEQQANTKPPDTNCKCSTGKPVIIATGEETLEQSDFALSGLIPIVWQRTYLSSNGHMERGPMGARWTSPYFAHLAIGKTAVYQHNGDGHVIEWPILDVGESHYEPYKKLTLTRNADADYWITGPQGDGLRFMRLGGDPFICQLVSSFDANGNQVQIKYHTHAPASNGAPASPLQRPRIGMISNGAHDVLFEYDATGHICKVLRLDPEQGAQHFDDRLNRLEQGITLAAYEYSAAGDLIAHIDSAGARRAYEYQNHLLTRQTTFTGFGYNLQWDGDTPWARCIRTWADDGSDDLRFGYDLQRRTTHITNVSDPAGPQISTYQFDQANQITRIVHANGTVTEKSYDGAGNPQGASDELGRTTQYSFNEFGQVTAVETPDGARTSIAYALFQSPLAGLSKSPVNPISRPVKITDALGGVTSRLYDPRGNLIASIDALGNQTRYENNPQGLPLVITDAKGGTKHLSWDAAGNLLSYTDCSRQTTRYEYDRLGSLLSVTNALGQATRYSYDAAQRLTQVDHPDGTRERFAYDAAGNLLAYADPADKLTRYAYDVQGRPVERTDALGATLRYVYDGAGRLSALVNENNEAHRFSYDTIGNLIAETTPDRRHIAYQYDAADQLTDIIEGAAAGADTDAGGASLHIALKRDPLGRLIEKRLRLQAGAATQDQPAATQPAMTDIPLALYNYDALGRLTEARNAVSRVRFGYDALGQLISEAQERYGHTVSHDDTQPIQALSSTATALPYGGALSPTARALLSTALPDVAEQAALAAMDPAQQARVAAARDAASALPEPLAAHTLRHSYDALGNRLSTTLPSGKTLQYLYYGSGHLHQVNLASSVSDADAGGSPAAHVIADIERDALHRQIERSHGATGASLLSSRFDYDPMGRLQGLRIARRAARGAASGDAASGAPGTPGLSALSALTTRTRGYTYDAAGNLTTIDDSARGATQYRYDAASRLRAVLNAAPGQPLATAELFAFDPAGNLLDAGGAGVGGAGGSTDSPNTTGLAGNRLTVFEDKRFAYDAFGNLLLKRIGAHTVQRFSWTAEHQLASVTVSRGGGGGASSGGTEQTTRYHYDALGRRIAKADAFGVTEFAWDGDVLVAELRGARRSEYVYEPGTFVPWAKLEHGVALVAAAATATTASAPSLEKPHRSIGAASGPKQAEEAQLARDYAVYHYHTDHLGTPQEMTDEAGRIVWQASYKAWGELRYLATGTDGGFTVGKRGSSGSVQTISSERLPQGWIDNPIRFQGQYFDAETGLHYNRYRYYDPAIGRFVNHDPIGLTGGENLFAYAPNPVGWVDPLGLSKKNKKDKNKNKCDDCEPCGSASRPWKMVYNENDGKHKEKGYWSGGNWISPKPTSGAAMLPLSVKFREKGRVGYDTAANEVIQFNRERVDDTNCIEYWHGFVVSNQPVPMNPAVAKIAETLGFKK